MNDVFVLNYLIKLFAYIYVFVIYRCIPLYTVINRYKPPLLFEQIFFFVYFL